MKHLNTQ